MRRLATLKLWLMSNCFIALLVIGCHGSGDDSTARSSKEIDRQSVATMALAVVGQSKKQIPASGQRQVTERFVIKNRGTAEVPLRVETSCGCTTAELSHASVAPSSEVNVRVTLDTAVQSTGTVWVCAGDGLADRVALTVSVPEKYIPSTSVRFYPWAINVDQPFGQRSTVSALIFVGRKKELSRLELEDVTAGQLEFDLHPGLEARLVPADSITDFHNLKPMVDRARTSLDADVSVFGVEFEIPSLKVRSRHRFFASCRLMGCDADPASISIVVDPE